MDKTGLKHIIHKKGMISQRKYLDIIHEIVLKKKGKCLSCIYKGNSSPLEWQCQKGHTWEMPASYIKDGSWCKKCKKIDLLNNMKMYAKRQGGECLSQKFINSHDKLLWRCGLGHVWKSNSAKYNKSWCPVCKQNGFYISEEKCRFILECFTGEFFEKTRSVLGNKLELDGYSEKLNLAFEYQGQQHFEKISFFHDNEDMFNKRKQLDELKVEICIQKNIKLIIIPYYINTSDECLSKYIYDKLIDKNIDIINKIVSWSLFSHENKILLKLQSIAKNNGGRLISKTYRGHSTKLEFECNNNHRWFTTPGNIRIGHWCYDCGIEKSSAKRRNSISNIQKLANIHNSTLISKEYKSSRNPIEWECNICKNQWTATLNAMKTRLLNKNWWCLFCKKMSRNDTK